MNALRRVVTHISGKNRVIMQKQVNRFYSSDLYEPPYLEAMKPKVPLYDTLNIQLKGYDYPILESFQKHVHRIAKNMDINVEETWALPATSLKVVTYKPQSEILNSEYQLKLYHRTVQITDISTLQLPILLRAIEACTPAGVSVEVVSHEDDHEEVRYIPDKELLTLKQTLEDMGGARKTK